MGSDDAEQRRRPCAQSAGPGLSPRPYGTIKSSVTWPSQGRSKTRAPSPAPSEVATPASMGSGLQPYLIPPQWACLWWGGGELSAVTQAERPLGAQAMMGTPHSGPPSSPQGSSRLRMTGAT